MAKTPRVGPAMWAAVEYVAAHPGCPKLPAAKAAGPNGSTAYGYQAVDRTMVAGLIEHRGQTGDRYALYVTDAGRTLLETHRKVTG